MCWVQNWFNPVVPEGQKGNWKTIRIVQIGAKYWLLQLSILYAIANKQTNKNKDLLDWVLPFTRVKWHKIQNKS